MPEESSVNNGEQRAMDNIPEFIDGSTPSDRFKEGDPNEYARHGAAMFATGVIEGLRQAIYAIQTNRTEAQPSHKWPGMNAAIAAIETTIAQRQAEKQSTS